MFAGGAYLIAPLSAYGPSGHASCTPASSRPEGPFVWDGDVPQIDTGNEKRASHAHGQAVKARENSAMYRTVVESEVKARADLQRTQEIRSTHVDGQGSRSYQQPAQGGPRRRRRQR